MDISLLYEVGMDGLMNKRIFECSVFILFIFLKKTRGRDCSLFTAYQIFTIMLDGRSVWSMLRSCIGDLIDDLVSVLFNGLVSRLHSVTSGVGNGGDVGSFVGNGGDGSVGIGNGGVASDVGSIVGDGGGGVGQSRSVAQSAVRVVSGSRVAQRSVAVETSVGQHLVVRLTSSDGHQGSEDNLNQKMNIGII